MAELILACDCLLCVVLFRVIRQGLNTQEAMLALLSDGACELELEHMRLATASNTAAKASAIAGGVQNMKNEATCASIMKSTVATRPVAEVSIEIHAECTVYVKLDHLLLRYLTHITSDTAHFLRFHTSAACLCLCLAGEPLHCSW